MITVDTACLTNKMSSKVQSLETKISREMWNNLFLSLRNRLLPISHLFIGILR